VLVTGLGYVCGYALSAMAGTDRTPRSSDVPGGAAEMTILGERFGARVDEVLRRNRRILIVVAGIRRSMRRCNCSRSIPRGARYAGPYWRVASATAAAASSAKTLNAERLRAGAPPSPFPWRSPSPSAVPRWMIDVAQLLLGCALGSDSTAAS
jgi:hypothetical protein